MPLMRGCSISGGYILANLGDFFKEFGETRGRGQLLPLSRPILDFTSLCADRGLGVGPGGPSMSQRCVPFYVITSFPCDS